MITLAELIMHGFLYQVLWWSDSWGMWVSEMKKFDMGHVSNLPGAVAWGAAVLMAAFAWPYVRRKAYRVRLFPHQPAPHSHAFLDAACAAARRSVTCACTLQCAAACKAAPARLSVEN